MHEKGFSCRHICTLYDQRPPPCTYVLIRVCPYMASFSIYVLLRSMLFIWWSRWCAGLMCFLREWWTSRNIEYLVVNRAIATNVPSRWFFDLFANIRARFILVLHSDCIQSSRIVNWYPSGRWLKPTHEWSEFRRRLAPVWLSRVTSTFSCYGMRANSDTLDDDIGSNTVTIREITSHNSRDTVRPSFYNSSLIIRAMGMLVVESKRSECLEGRILVPTRTLSSITTFEHKSAVQELRKRTSATLCIPSSTPMNSTISCSHIVVVSPPINVYLASESCTVSRSCIK